MNILITGAAGFVGKNLCESLKNIRDGKDRTRPSVVIGEIFEYDIDTNPWDYLDADGMPLNYLQAYRLHYGYSSGPWDCWKGPDSQPLWNDELKCFLSKDDYC